MLELTNYETDYSYCIIKIRTTYNTCIGSQIVIQLKYMHLKGMDFEYIIDKYYNIIIKRPVD